MKEEHETKKLTFPSPSLSKQSIISLNSISDQVKSWASATLFKSRTVMPPFHDSISQVQQVSSKYYFKVQLISYQYTKYHQNNRSSW